MSQQSQLYSIQLEPPLCIAKFKNPQKNEQSILTSEKQSMMVIFWGFFHNLNVEKQLLRVMVTKIILHRYTVSCSCSLFTHIYFDYKEVPSPASYLFITSNERQFCTWWIHAGLWCKTPRWKDRNDQVSNFSLGPIQISTYPNRQTSPVYYADLFHVSHFLLGQFPLHTWG